jgi:hypothetical protein
LPCRFQPHRCSHHLECHAVAGHRGFGTAHAPRLVPHVCRLPAATSCLDEISAVAGEVRIRVEAHDVPRGGMLSTAQPGIAGEAIFACETADVDDLRHQCRGGHGGDATGLPQCRDCTVVLGDRGSAAVMAARCALNMLIRWALAWICSAGDAELDGRRVLGRWSPWTIRRRPAELSPSISSSSVASERFFHWPGSGLLARRVRDPTFPTCLCLGSPREGCRREPGTAPGLPGGEASTNG